jgi:hypothetical protein
MVDLLLYTTLTCQQADAIMLRVKANEDLNKMIKIELLETVKESTPECKWDAND